MRQMQVKLLEHRAAVAEAAAAASTRATTLLAPATPHAATFSCSSMANPDAAASADAIAHLKQRLDKATRELSSERQKCEAAVLNSAQLQQRLDAALSISSAADAMSFGIEALLPPSPPRLNVDPHACALSSAASSSPAPSLHSQLSEISVCAADARAMASAAAATSASAAIIEASTLERVHARSTAATASCSRIAGGLSCVLRRLQCMQMQLREQQLQLNQAQVTVNATQRTPICSLFTRMQRRITFLNTAAACSTITLLLFLGCICLLLHLDFDDLYPFLGVVLPQ